MEKSTRCTTCGQPQPYLNNFCSHCGAPLPAAKNRATMSHSIGARVLTIREMGGIALLIACLLAFLLAPVWLPDLSPEMSGVITMLQIIIFLLCPIIGFIGYGLFIAVKTLVREWKAKKAHAAHLCLHCNAPDPGGAKFCAKCGASLSWYPARTTTHFQEVLLTAGAIVLYTVFSAILPNIFSDDPGYFVAGILPVLILAGRSYLERDRKAQDYSLVRYVASAILFFVFFAGQHQHNATKAATIEFVKQTAHQVDLVCKQNGKCPEKIEGFVCNDVYSSGCTTQVNGYKLQYGLHNGDTIGEFNLGGRLDGYETFYMNGGVTKPIEEHHRHSS